MGGILLSHGKRAGTPFYVEHADLRIYSYEELCYFISHALYLLDRSLMSEELCGWVERQLGLKELAQDLRVLIERESGLTEFLERIITDGSYLTAAEIVQVVKSVREILCEPDCLRRKKRGDMLVKNRRYRAALHEYEHVLTTNEAEPYPEFYIQVHNNMAVAFVRMFRLKDASRHFLEAYKMSKDESILEEFTASLRLGLSKEHYETLVKSDQVDKELAKGLEQRIQELLEVEKLSPEYKKLEEAAALARDGNPSGLDGILTEWKKEYRKNIS